MFGWVALGATVLLCLLVVSVRRGTLGRRMLAVRSNERAAAGAAINVRNVKLAAFGISALIAGVAGTLYAYNFGSVSADRFSVPLALSLIAFAYAGGITLVSGAVFAGLIAAQGIVPYSLDKWFGLSGNWFLLFGGVVLIFTLIQNPEGVAGSFYRTAQAWQRKRAEGRLGMSAVLTTAGLSVRFGGVHAVEDVDLAVEEGQLVGLIGPNGAGKTTFIDAITGFVRYTGAVELDGRDLAGLPPHARARRGLARTWQSTELFDDLTVRENLEVGAERPSFFALTAEVVGRRIPTDESPDEALRAPRSRRHRGRHAGRTRAGPAEARRCCPGDRNAASASLPRRARGRPRHARERGPGSAAPTDCGRWHHDAADRPRHGARVVHLRPHRRARVRTGDRGGIAGRGAPRCPRREGVPRRRRRHTGGHQVGGRRPRRGWSRAGMSAPVLEIDDLTAGYDSAAVIRDISLEVAAGDVVALLGANGAGKTTTLRTVSGLVHPMSGAIRVEGRDLRRVSASARARLGIAHVPESRGLFFGLTVAEHLRLGYRGERLDADAAYRYFPALSELRDRRCGLLSGESSRCWPSEGLSPGIPSFSSSTSSASASRQ